MKRALLCGIMVISSILTAAETTVRYPNIPAGYLLEAEYIPDFWASRLEDVNRFLDGSIHEGAVATIGITAGGRQLRAVSYGHARQGKGTTTLSGSLGFGDVRAYTGPDAEKRVYMGIAGVHGGEFEGIVGMVNLLAVLETGADLRGKPWPDITAAAKSIDRIVIVPVMNPDGRARVPLRMGRYRGSDETIPEYFNTGGWPDGRNIGWPDCKQFIPLDFSRTQFPGGYPNDNGVNIQHDDFFGQRQPETEALFRLAVQERPDLILNMHTGAVFPLMHRPFAEPALTPVFEELFRRVQTGLMKGGLQASNNPREEADPARVATPSPYNLDTALNLHCGALSVVIESPSHAASTAQRGGKPFVFRPDDLLDAQLICHQQAMKFLVDTGGRSRWTPPRKRN
jgi:Zinc carboxypeptidase